MRIACFQGPEVADIPAGNLARLKRVAGEARRRGAALLICPELYLTGYAIGADAIAKLAEPLDGASVKTACAIAAEAGIALVFGLPESDGPRIYNTAVAIGADGKVLARYRKTHLFGAVDREQFSPGSSPPAIFELGGLRAAMLICYDIEFPENVRMAALRGAEFIIAPTALMRPYDVVANVIVPARAFENQLFFAYVDRCGREDNFDYCGLSCVAGPDGSILARAGSGEELILADLDPVKLARSRHLNTHLEDRRPELYAGLAQGTETAR
jgi:predicted amidohydrolase